MACTPRWRDAVVELSGGAPAASRRERWTGPSTRLARPLRQPEQPTDPFVNTPGRHHIPEGDGAAQGAG
ncbi:hypothetical protein [Sorangium cellulosum]|nr:hypothetical protein [Sorangium cellulosum]